MVLASNGTGKTSLLIERPLSIFNSNYISKSESGRSDDNGRLTAAEALRASRNGHILMSAIDFMLDEQMISDGCDMVMVGKVIDGSNTGTDPNKVREHGIRFILPHSSEIYDNVENEEFKPYEALGLKFVEWADGYGKKPTIRPFVDVRKEIERAVKSASKQGGVFTITSAQNAEFLEKVKDATGFDAARYLSIFSGLLGVEGLDSISKYKPEEFYNAIVYTPLHNMFLSKSSGENASNEDNYVGELANYVEKDAHGVMMRSADRYINTKLADAGKLKRQLDELKTSESNRDEAKEELDRLYSQAITERDRTDDMVVEAEAKVTEIAADIATAQYKLSSRNVYTAQDEFDKASDVFDSAESASKGKQIALRKAELIKNHAAYNKLYEMTQVAQGKLDAAQAALSAKESGKSGSRITDLAYTLRTLHEQRIADSQKNIDTKETEIEMLNAGLDKAKGDREKVSTELTNLKVKIGTLRNNQIKDYDLLKSRIGALVQDGTFNDKKHLVSKSLFSDSVKNAQRVTESARGSRKRAEDALNTAKAAVEAAGAEVKHSREVINQIDVEFKALVFKKSSIDKAKESLKPFFDLVSNVDSIADAQREQNKFKRDLDFLREKNSELAVNLKETHKQIDAAEEGEFFLPASVCALLNEAGIAYQTGEAYLRGRTTQIPEILERIPYLASSIVCDDRDIDDVRHMIEDNPTTDWFAGVVPVLPLSVCEGTSDSKLIGISHLDNEYLNDSQGRIGDLNQKVEQIQSDMAQNDAKLERLNDVMDALHLYEINLNQAGYTSATELALAYGESANALTDAKDALKIAETNYEKKIEARESRNRDLEDAEAALKKAENIVTNLEGSKIKVNEIAKYVDQIESLMTAIDEAENHVKTIDNSINEIDSSIKDGQAALLNLKTELERVKGEINNVAVQKTGTLIDGEFTKLSTEYFQLVESWKEEIAPLRQAQRQANDALNEAEAAEETRLDHINGLLKDYCDLVNVNIEKKRVELFADHKVPTSAEIESYSLACEKAQRELNEAQVAMEAASNVLDERRKSLSDAREAFKREHEGRELYPDRAELNDDFPTYISIKEREKNGLEQQKDTLEKRKNRLNDFVFDAKQAGADLLSEKNRINFKKIDDLAVFKEELSEAARSFKISENNFVTKRNDYLGNAARFSDTASYKEDVRQYIGEVCASISGHIKSVRDYEQKRIDVAGVERDLKIVINNLEASSSTIKDSIRMKDVGLEAAIKNLMGTLDESIHYLVGLVKSSGDQIRIKNIKRTLPRDEYERKFGEYIKQVLHGISEVADLRNVGGFDQKEEIRKQIKSQLVNIKSLIAIHVMLNAGAQKHMEMEFRSTRAEDNGAWLKWGGVKGLSGGERGQIYFTLLTLLAKTAVTGDEKTKTSFILLDNPFANLGDDDRWDSCLEVAKKNNVQIIATAMPSAPAGIVDCFPYRYVLSKYKCGAGYTQKTERAAMPEQDKEHSLLISRSIKLRGSAGTASLF